MLTAPDPRRLRPYVLGLVVLTALVALGSLAMRWRVESANKAAGIALELPALEEIASASGVETPEALRRLAEQGLTGVVLTAPTLGELDELGVVSVRPEAPGLTLIAGDAAEAQLTPLRLRFRELESPATSMRRFAAPVDVMMATPVGIDPARAQMIRDAGLQVIARHPNVPAASEPYIFAVVEQLAQAGASAFLPVGDSVLGERAMRKGFQQALAQHNLTYLSAEFVRTAGESPTLAAIPDRVVRLHSIQVPEAMRLTDSAYVERFGKAFRERNIRWLLLRPGPLDGSAPLDSLSRLVAQVNRAVVDAGGAVRSPRPFAEPGAPTLLLIAVPFVAMLTLALAAWAWLPRWNLQAAGLLVLLGWASVVSTGRDFAALAAAVGFPLVAYAYLLSLERPNPWREYVVMAGISLVGGLVVAGTLNGLKHMVVADQFMGVKAAHFAPIFIVGVMLLLHVHRWSDLAQRPLLLGSTVLSLFGLAALGFMWTRTGNDNPAGVSGLELQFRAVLDAVLHTRPRTKEFLIGHPALLLGLFAWRVPRWRGASAVLLTIGAIGLTSIVNTMCHLHTPLDVSLPRIGIGLVLGGIIGGSVWVLFFAKRASAGPAS